VDEQIQQGRRMSADEIKSKGSVDLSDEQVHWDLGSSLSYGEYLHLDKLLSAQQPLSPRHDEMLFIVIHQASELWIKLCLHEITAAIECVRRDDLGPSFKMLARVSRIQTQLVQSWDVLATMTPADYSGFRNHLGRASGFQSFQYRLLEFSLGNKNAEMIEVHRRDRRHTTLQRALAAPGLYGGRCGCSAGAATAFRATMSIRFQSLADPTSRWRLPGQRLSQRGSLGSV
jgi:tryptophan 2,3-dioxygenase